MGIHAHTHTHTCNDITYYTQDGDTNKDTGEDVAKDKQEEKEDVAEDKQEEREDVTEDKQEEKEDVTEPLTLDKIATVKQRKDTLNKATRSHPPLEKKSSSKVKIPNVFQSPQISPLSK